MSSGRRLGARCGDVPEVGAEGPATHRLPGLEFDDVTVTALLTCAGAAGWQRLRPWHVALRGGLAAMFLFTGVSHFGAFGKRDDLVAMVPPTLPAPELLVSITGILELAGAVGLVLPVVWPWAAAGLSALLVAMFPANIYKALEDPTLRASQELGPPHRSADSLPGSDAGRSRTLPGGAPTRTE